MAQNLTKVWCKNTWVYLILEGVNIGLRLIENLNPWYIVHNFSISSKIQSANHFCKLIILYDSHFIKSLADQLLYSLCLSNFEKDIIWYTLKCIW